jgi:Xaa-Pro aminopeptidase
MRTHRVTLAVILALLTGTGAQVRAQIPATEYAARRSALLERLGPGAYYFEAAPPAAADYLPWEQDPDFLYLTGHLTPSARLVMVRAGTGTRQVVFIRGGSATTSVWEGEDRPGPVGDTLELRPADEYETFVKELAAEVPKRLVTPHNPAQGGGAGRLLEQLGGLGSVEVVNPRQALTGLRALKSPAEIELLVMAGRITAAAQREAFRATEPGLNEFEIQALIEYTFRRNGALRPGFASIVGSGPNSTILHYQQNDRFMRPGEVVVMDIGALYEHYTADVTRTIPVSGIFTPEQRAIYEIVLAAHDAAETVARTPGASFREVSAAASRVLAEGCARLGLIENPDAVLPGSRRTQLSLFYMHGLGHGIGLVVHDSMPPTLEVGTCFTIEPGLYIRPDALERIGEGPEADRLRARLAPVVARYADIGIRIEDCYAVTADRLVCLSEGAPRTVAEIEAMMAQPSFTTVSRDRGLVESFRKYAPPPR